MVYVDEEVLGQIRHSYSILKTWWSGLKLEEEVKLTCCRC